MTVAVYAGDAVTEVVAVYAGDAPIEKIFSTKMKYAAFL